MATKKAATIAATSDLGSAPAAPPGASPGAPPADLLEVPPANTPAGAFIRLVDLVLSQPAAYRQTANVYRVPANGDATAAGYVDRIPLSEVPDAQHWVAQHPQGGPGWYRLDVLDARTSRVAAGARFSVDSDLRRGAATAAPPPVVDVAAPVQSIPPLLQQLADTRRELSELRELIAVQRPGGQQQQSSPLATAQAVIQMARDLAPAPATTTIAAPSNPRELLDLGLQMGRELGRAGSETTFGSMVLEQAPKLLDLGEAGIEVLKLAIGERRATREERARERAAAKTTTKTGGGDE